MEQEEDPRGNKRLREEEGSANEYSSSTKIPKVHNDFGEDNGGDKLLKNMTRELLYHKLETRKNPEHTMLELLGFERHFIHPLAPSPENLLLLKEWCSRSGVQAVTVLNHLLRAMDSEEGSHQEVERLIQDHTLWKETSYELLGQRNHYVEDAFTDNVKYYTMLRDLSDRARRRQQESRKLRVQLLYLLSTSFYRVLNELKP